MQSAWLFTATALLLPAAKDGPKFFLSDPVPEFQAAEQCFLAHVGPEETVDSRLHPRYAQHLAAFWLTKRLAEHPNRVHTAQEADLHILTTPIFTSWVAAHHWEGFNCGKLTHHWQRMDKLAARVRQSKEYQAKKPMLLAHTFYQCETVWGKDFFDVMNARHMVLGTGDTFFCSELFYTRRVILPYVAHGSLDAAAHAGTAQHKTWSFFFHGSADRGREGAYRKELLDGLEARLPRTNFRTVWRTRVMDLPSMVSLVRSTASQIQGASFCLVLPGDSTTSRRLFDALAAGCVPIIFDVGMDMRAYDHEMMYQDWTSDAYRRNLPFKRSLDWDDVAVFFGTASKAAASLPSTAARLQALGNAHRSRTQAAYRAGLSYRHGHGLVDCLLLELLHLEPAQSRGLLSRPPPGAAERAHIAEQREAQLRGDVPPRSDDKDPGAEAAAVLSPPAAQAATNATAAPAIAADPEGLDGPDASLVVGAARRQLVFMHIPKNAGTTIENLGAANGVQWGRFDTLAGAHPGLDPFDTHKVPGFPSSDPERPRAYDGCSEWHMPPDALPKPNPYVDPNSEVFCVTRDPWERMVSEYTYQVGKKHEFRFDPSKAAHFQTLRVLIPDGVDCTKEGLNGFVEQVLERAKHRPSVLNCHMVPQWRFIESPDGQRWCDHILPIDQLTQRFNALMKQTGLAPRLAPHDDDNASESCPWLRKLARENIGELFTPSARALMRMRYKDDFEHLGDQLAPKSPAMVLREPSTRAEQPQSPRADVAEARTPRAVPLGTNLSFSGETPERAFFHAGRPGEATTVWVVGFGRSGTSLVQEVVIQAAVEAGASVFGAFEPCHRDDRYFGVRLGEDAARTQQCLEQVLRCDFAGLDLRFQHRTSDLAPGSGSLGQRCAEAQVRVFKTIHPAPTTGPGLGAAPRGTKVLRVVRDPRATFSSMRGLPNMHAHAPLAFAEVLCEDLQRWSADQRPNVRHVQFEDLVTTPVPVVRAMVDFIGLTLAPELETYLTTVFSPPTCPPADRPEFSTCRTAAETQETLTKWRRLLSVEEKQRFASAACQATLSEYGYARDHDDRADRATERSPRLGGGHALLRKDRLQPGLQPSSASPGLCVDGRLVPQLYLLGAQKCATSSLAEALRQRGIRSFAYPSKELHWFDDSVQSPLGRFHPFKASTRSPAEAQKWAQRGPPCQPGVLADYTPVNLRLGDDLPSTLTQYYGPKADRLVFVALLRDPLERLQSAYYHEVYKMRHPPQKINAWRTAADIFPPKDPKPEYATFARYTQEIVTLLDRTPRDRWASTKLLDGVYRSLYAAQLSHFLDHFAPHQFVILPFRHFIDEPTQTVNAIRRAVGLAPGQAFSKAPWAGKKLAKPPLSSDLPAGPVRTELEAVFAADLAQLCVRLADLRREGLQLLGFHGQTADDVKAWLLGSWA